MSYYPEDYLFEADFVTEDFSDGEESVHAYEPYISYDDDMAAFEDEEFYRAYNVSEDYEEEEDDTYN
jgi:hypothetical protein